MFKYRASALFVQIAACFILALFTAAFGAEYSKALTGEERISEISSHVTVLHEGAMAFYRFNFDQSGEIVDKNCVPGGEALEIAAIAYALRTADFSVSLQDLADSGFWPYNTFPSGTNMSDLIPPNTRFSPNLEVTNGIVGGGLIDMAETPEWVLMRRVEILNTFNQFYYLDYFGTIEPPRLAEAVKYPQFWMNPITGDRMKEGNLRGDFSMWSIQNVADQQSPFPREYSFQVPNINVCDVVEEEACCLFRMDYTQNIQGYEQRVKWTCLCPFNYDLIYMECILSWWYDCFATRTQWFLVTSSWDCSRPVPQDGGTYVIRHPGERAPETIWAANCRATILEDTCLFYTCPTSPPDPIVEACIAAWHNFHDNITKTQQGSAPGEMCGGE